jgi:predicted unusual protein kinase regulating ubiquinone biosynthesis (AarF/ABC1/UbiB family)
VKIIEDIISAVVVKMIKEIEDLAEELDFDQESNPIEQARKQLKNQPKYKRIRIIQMVLFILNGISNK